MPPRAFELTCDDALIWLDVDRHGVTALVSVPST